MKKAIGSNYKETIANVLPLNSFDLAITDAKTFFHEEIPSMKLWTFTKNQAKDLRDKKSSSYKRITKNEKHK